MQETRVWSLGGKDPLVKGMATHSSILAWRISWTEKPGGLPSMGSHRVGHDWSDLGAEWLTHTLNKQRYNRIRVTTRRWIWLLKCRNSSWNLRNINLTIHILVKSLYSKNTAKLSEMLAGKSCYFNKTKFRLAKDFSKSLWTISLKQHEREC